MQKNTQHSHKHPSNTVTTSLQQDPFAALQKETLNQYIQASKQRAEQSGIPIWAKNYDTIIINLSPYNNKTRHLPSAKTLAKHVISEADPERFSFIKLFLPDIPLTTSINLIVSLEHHLAKHIKTNETILSFPARNTKRTPQHKQPPLTKRYGIPALSVIITKHQQDLTIDFSPENSSDAHKGIYAINAINELFPTTIPHHLTLQFRHGGEPYQQIAATLAHFQTHARLHNHLLPLLQTTTHTISTS